MKIVVRACSIHAMFLFFCAEFTSTVMEKEEAVCGLPLVTERVHSKIQRDLSSRETGSSTGRAPHYCGGYRFESGTVSLLFSEKGACI